MKSSDVEVRFPQQQELRLLQDLLLGVRSSKVTLHDSFIDHLTDFSSGF